MVASTVPGIAIEPTPEGLTNFVQTQFTNDPITQDPTCVVQKIKVSMFKGNINIDGRWVVSNGSSKSELEENAQLIGTNVNKVKVINYLSVDPYDESSFNATTSLINDFTLLTKAADLHQYYILDTEGDNHITMTLPPNGTEIVVVRKGTNSSFTTTVKAGELGGNTFDGDLDHTSIDLITDNEKFTLVYNTDAVNSPTWHIL